MDLGDKAMIIVVNRRTRQVLDAARLEYSWDLDKLVKEHDLDQVDIILRNRTSTVVPKAVPEDTEEPLEAPSADISPLAGIGPDDDVPF